jgi:hypothetical protein
MPTAGVDVRVVFAFKLRPNWLVPRTPVVDELICVTVFEPDVSVGPFTVTEYPAPAFVDAAICDVDVAVSVGEKSWLNDIAPAVAVAQSGTPPLVLTVAPVQKTNDSGMVPVRTICSLTLALTVPVSMAEPVAFVAAKVEILTKNVQLGAETPGDGLFKGQSVASGLVMVNNWYVSAEAADIPAAVRVIYGAPLVVLTSVNPVAPDWVPIVAEVVVRPAGVVQVPAAKVQYLNSIEPTLAAVGTVKAKKWFTTPLRFEPPSEAPA